MGPYFQNRPEPCPSQTNKQTQGHMKCQIFANNQTVVIGQQLRCACGMPDASVAVDDQLSGSNGPASDAATACLTLSSQINPNIPPKTTRGWQRQAREPQEVIHNVLPATANGLPLPFSACCASTSCLHRQRDAPARLAVK
jgi:hypothetical protein